MLRNLHISNYALIDCSDIDFSDGFTVITGETGAGKSIILGALALLTGQRADAKAIKTGEKKCTVEATFDVSNLNLESLFAEADIDFDPTECIVRREVSATGKSRAFVNDTPATAAFLKQLSEHIIDVHSQHQNLLLSREHFLLDVLDAVAADQAEVEAYTKTFADWRKARRELHDLEEELKASLANADFLRDQLEELEDANIQKNEQEELEQEQTLLSHAEDIKTHLYAAASVILDDEPNVSGHLMQAIQSLRAAAKFLPFAGELAERMESAKIEVDDIAAEADVACMNVEYDPARLGYVNDRLSTIYRLEKKHKVETVDQLLTLQTDLEQQLMRIDCSDDLIARKRDEVEKLAAEVKKTCDNLTALRTAAARTTEDALRESLHQLGMPNVKIHFALTQRTEPDARGMDNVQLLFSANKNVPEQDVAEIASGGETARLMLALKAFLSQRRTLPTIIFDEIDTGVSGTMAERMATVMQQMAAHCQVICITHLPQIAALGTQHLRVYKQETDAGTSSHIVPLTTDERIEEIANMLSGAETTQAAIDNAKALLRIT